MINAIIFDVGGVLIRTHDHQPRRDWERKLGLRPWEAEEIVFSSDMGAAAQQGKLGNEELWDWIGRRLKLSATQLAQFRHDFWSGDVLDGDLVRLIRSLRPEYQTAIISNATDSLRRQLQEELEIADAFDLIVCSAEEGIMKPHPDIYRRALSRLGRQPQEAVFVDDAPENVAAARDLGLHAIHYQEGLDLRPQLSRLGITVPHSAKHSSARYRTQGEEPHA